MGAYRCIFVVRYTHRYDSYGVLTSAWLGSPDGWGGGIVLVPLLSIVFGVDIRYAIDASLVLVFATSSVACAAYMKE